MILVLDVVMSVSGECHTPPHKSSSYRAAYYHADDRGFALATTVNLILLLSTLCLILPLETSMYHHYISLSDPALTLIPL